MHGPYHDFLLLPERDAGRQIYTEFWDADLQDTGKQPTYRAFRRTNKAIRVPDNLIGYMFDTLDWVPTEHPFEEAGWWGAPWRGYGLDYHAHTAIRKRGAPVFRQVCETWAALFSLAPRNFALRGDWLISEERYERIESHRKEIVPLLQKLVDHAEQASTGEFFILHVGL